MQQFQSRKALAEMKQRANGGESDYVGDLSPVPDSRLQRAFSNPNIREVEYGEENGYGKNKNTFKELKQKYWEGR